MNWLHVRYTQLTLILLGITSFGRGCGRVGVPGVYTNINDPNILDWIHMALEVAHNNQQWDAFMGWIKQKSAANTWRIIPGIFCELNAFVGNRPLAFMRERNIL